MKTNGICLHVRCKVEEGGTVMNIPTTTLHNGVKMPMLGLGVYKAQEGEEVKRAVKKALEVGYRSIDTATVYENESGVGEAIRESGIAREELLLQQKYGMMTKGMKQRFKHLKEV